MKKFIIINEFIFDSLDNKRFISSIELIDFTKYVRYIGIDNKKIKETKYDCFYDVFLKKTIPINDKIFYIILNTSFNKIKDLSKIEFLKKYELDEWII
jgi:hypothetical protein